MHLLFASLLPKSRDVSLLHAGIADVCNHQRYYYCNGLAVDVTALLVIVEIKIINARYSLRFYWAHIKLAGLLAAFPFFFSVITAKPIHPQSIKHLIRRLGGKRLLWWTEQTVRISHFTQTNLHKASSEISDRCVILSPCHCSKSCVSQAPDSPLLLVHYTSTTSTPCTRRGIEVYRRCIEALVKKCNSRWGRKTKAISIKDPAWATSFCLNANAPACALHAASGEGWVLQV